MLNLLSHLLLLLADAIGIVCMARLLLQWAQLNYRHPLAQFCTRSTDWLIRPLRKIVPPLGRWDSACVAATFLVYLVVSLFCHAVLPWQPITAKLMAVDVLLSLLFTLKAAAYALLSGLILLMIFSFSQPYSPLMTVLRRVFDPLTRPFAFLRFRQIDFSATVVALILWLWLSVGVPQCVAYLAFFLIQP